MYAVQAGHHRAQQIDRQSAPQTAQMENTDRTPFTPTFHPLNHAVKSIILKNFKLLRNDSETDTIFSQPPLISFKRDKNKQRFGQNTQGEKRKYLSHKLLCSMLNFLH